LGWKPQTAWEDGLAQTVEWYLKNCQWVKAIEIGVE
jgi:dTDP-D-glucose 4,6-dehydratase